MEIFNPESEEKNLTYIIKTLVERETYPWIDPLHHCKHNFPLHPKSSFWARKENSKRM